MDEPANKHKAPELLAPAGNPAKLKTALHFGADAVYLGLREYSLRVRAGNFDLDQLAWAIGYAHERGRRVYVAVNLQPFDADLDGLRAALTQLGKLHPAPDGIIVADAGVLALARELAPDVPLHLSTQASVTNAAAAEFWFAQGVSRIIVARELSVQQLTALAGAVRGRGGIECFIHGAVCVAWSGRCMLSMYWAGPKRDARRGDCAAACRWPFRRIAIEDRRRPGEPNLVEEDERGTHFFDAKDTCALPLLAGLIRSGVESFKIEGRSRSAFYVGLTVDVYRHAIDRLVAGDKEGFARWEDRYLAELTRSSYRGFSTHFLGGEQDLLESYNPGGSYADGRGYQFVGPVVASHSDGLVLDCRVALRPGAKLEICDRGLQREALTLDTLVTSDGETLEQAVNGQRLVLPGPLKAGVNALVRLAPTDDPDEPGKP